MTLRVVWRNPEPPVVSKPLVRRIIADARGALYEIRRAHEINVFELLEHRAA